MSQEQIEGKNPVIEALQRRKRKLHRVLMDQQSREGDKIRTILRLAKEQDVEVEWVNRDVLKKYTKGRVHNGVIAFAEPLSQLTVQGLVEQAFSESDSPLIVLADEIVYEHNLGAILRSAMGAGANGLIIPNRRGTGVSPVVARVAMGGAEEVPVVRAGILSALKRLRKSGFRTIGADMGGVDYWDADFTGPVALILGGESKGLTEPIQKRCDTVVSVPLDKGLESLNVSVTAGVLLFERIRQISKQSS